MNIIDKRLAFRGFPGREVLESIISHFGEEGLKAVNSVTILDTDVEASWHHGLTARSALLPETEKIDIKIFYEGSSMPQQLLASPIFNTYFYAKAFLSEVYQHMTLGKADKRSPESTLTASAIEDWVLADAQRILAELYPPSENKEEYSKLNEVLRGMKQR